jgi:putative GTP pyrophosphokinase
VSDDRKTPQEWAREFSEVRGRHVNLTDALTRLVGQILVQAEIDVSQLESRTKAVDSFAEKIVRKGEKYGSPLAEITDLVGLRVILYYPDDVLAVGALLEKEFEVDWSCSFRQDPEAEPDRFGYRSDHYVVRLKPQRGALPEWKPFEGLCAEIQVRTVMQHAWAAVDHKIRYKAPDLPADLQRRLYRLSALLELADGQFASLQQASDDAVGSYEESVKAGDLGVSLDVLSLRAYLDQTGVGETWSERALAVGFAVPAGDGIERQSDRTEELLRHLQAGGFSFLRQFEDLLVSADRWGDEALAAVVRTAKETALVGYTGVGSIRAVPEHVLLILIQLAMQDAAAVDMAGWRADIAIAIKRAFGLASFQPSAPPRLA